MERMIKLFALRKDDAVRMLTTQYRMHQDIMSWSSHTFYDGRLTAHSSVANHLLKDLDGVSDSILTNSSLLLLDTAGCGLKELSHDGNFSISNRGEAELVSCHSSWRQASDISNTQFLVTRYPNISNSCNICDFLIAGGTQGGPGQL